MGNKMNILQIIPYFEWSYGGPVRVVYELSRELAQMGHEVTIYTTDVGMRAKLKDEQKIHLDKCIEVRYFNCLSNYISNNFKMHFSLDMYYAMRANIKKFDIIHLHEYRGIPNVCAHYFARKKSIPYILQAHGSSPGVIGYQEIDRTLSKQLFDNIIGNKIANNASKLIALTSVEAESYQRLGANCRKIEIIPNGINLTEFKNLPRKGKFREIYKISSKALIILFLGRINKIKGLDILAHAFSDIVKELRNAKLVIIGPDDGYLKTLEHLTNQLELSDKVIFIGPLYGVDKLEAYVDADIYVLPSVYETFPLTVLEALACGTSVVVTDNCGISDTVIKLGGFVSSSDSSDLGRVIIQALTTEKRGKGGNDKSRSVILNDFNWTTIAKRYEDLYMNVLLTS